ncbi:restriction endonuclease subunit S [Psychroserpens luteolus]|uniref:restriction endonuclease subunit S n=1 Tax=Psychroserpens luteolus TaxID=2855840 RepID=UPI001E5F3C5F|nr:restriction endonuclease subunit S [Psychroserpens luteolus]MCD2259492.1 restriction endonuclease subunit S [Psychroserpens luteolus]
MKNIEWGKYKFDKLFKICKVSNKLSKSDLVSNAKIPVFSSESTNNGIIGYTDKKAEFIISSEIPYYIVFGDHTRTFNIAIQDFCVADNVKVLQPLSSYSKNELLFIISSWKKCVPDKGYSRHWSVAKKVYFQLPTKDDKIDFDFMGRFVAEIENKTNLKLENYISDNGLSDCHLTELEKRTLNKYENIEWREFKMSFLFQRIKTIKLPYKAKDLPNQQSGNHSLPCLTSSFNNQGLNYYAPREGATVLKNVISIPSNSDVYRAYFQSNEFTVLSDAYAIEWVFNEDGLKPNQYLFAVQCINKVTDLPIYSYKNKLGGWNVAKDKYIQLPAKNSKPDYEIMENLISAIKKLVIKNVVLHVENKKKELNKQTENANA